MYVHTYPALNSEGKKNIYIYIYVLSASSTIIFTYILESRNYSNCIILYVLYFKKKKIKN